MLKYRRTESLGNRVITAQWFISLNLLVIFALWRLIKWGWQPWEPYTTNTNIWVTLVSSAVGVLIVGGIFHKIRFGPILQSTIPWSNSWYQFRLYWLIIAFPLSITPCFIAFLRFFYEFDLIPIWVNEARTVLAVNIVGTILGIMLTRRYFRHETDWYLDMNESRALTDPFRDTLPWKIENWNLELLLWLRYFWLSVRFTLWESLRKSNRR